MKTRQGHTAMEHHQTGLSNSPRIQTLDGKDDLTDSDYREVYEELRQYDSDSSQFRVSLRRFAEMIDSEYSHALWSKYDSGKMDLTSRMKMELRAAVGLPVLPLFLAQSVSELDESVDLVMLVPENGDGLNYLVLANREDLDRETGRFRPAPDPKKPPRRRYVRPAVPPELDERRERLGVSWADVIQAGLDALDDRT